MLGLSVNTFLHKRSSLLLERVKIVQNKVLQDCFNLFTLFVVYSWTITTDIRKHFLRNSYDQCFNWDDFSLTWKELLKPYLGI